MASTDADAGTLSKVAPSVVDPDWKVEVVEAQLDLAQVSQTVERQRFAPLFDDMRPALAPYEWLRTFLARYRNI